MYWHDVMALYPYSSLIGPAILQPLGFTWFAVLTRSQVTNVPSIGSASMRHLVFISLLFLLTSSNKNMLSCCLCGFRKGGCCCWWRIKEQMIEGMMSDWKSVFHINSHLDLPCQHGG
mmetsp:Transcript_11446/g.18407  ORF Transcript_11446/g.18407 Transcript_11446/m.18407 type:complete len:117 (+) Transcript_11446:27-377(+)